MTKLVNALAFGACLTCATSASALVSFDDVRYLHADGGANSREDASPSLATDGAGNWVAATDGPWVSTSSDGGDTWSAPVLLPGGDGYQGALDTDPQVVHGANGTWIVTEMVFDGIAGDDEILVWRSTDDGATWSAAFDVAATAGTSFDARPRIATDGAGKWIIVWQAEEPLNDDNDIMFATSGDDGLTWSTGAWLNADATTDALDDWYPAVATDGSGNWVVVAARLGAMPADWKVQSYRSTDFGASWAGPVQVSTHIGLAWTDVVAGGTGIFLTLHTKAGAIVGRSTNGGASWTEKTISGDYPSTDAHPAHLATNGAGEWVAVWDSEEDIFGIKGDDFDILYSKSLDNGVNWSEPRPVDPADAFSDTALDSRPTVAYGDGRWIAAWQRPTVSSNDIVMVISDPLCPALPRTDCLVGESGKASFSIGNNEADEKDKLKFKMSKVEATDVADFGNPAASDSLLLCLWDNTTGGDELVWRARLPAGVTCGGEPCWTTSSTGYGYKDKEKENSAFAKAKLKAGAAGKAQVSAQLAGIAIEPPAMPLVSFGSVDVQLISEGTDQCWGASFTSPKTNSSEKYSAKSD